MTWEPNREPMTAGAGLTACADVTQCQCCCAAPDVLERQIDYELRAARSNAPSAARISAGSGWPGRRAPGQGARMNHCGECEPHAGASPAGSRVVRLLCLPVPLLPWVAPVCHMAACRASCPGGAAEALSRPRRARRDDRRLTCAGQRASARPGQVTMRGRWFTDGIAAAPGDRARVRARRGDRARTGPRPR